MNTLINILPWIAAIGSVALYIVKTAQFKVLQEKSSKKINEELNNNTSLLQEIEHISNRYQEYKEENLTLKYDLSSLKADNQALKEMLQDPSKNPEAVDLRLFLKNYEDLRFVNSGTINTRSIKLKDIEIIHEEHINVIRNLAKEDYFRNDLKKKFNYNPSTGEVNFYLFEFDSEGDPIKVKNFKDFLQERLDFKNTITEYIVGLIGQRAINKAVDKAIAEKEVVNG